MLKKGVALILEVYIEEWQVALMKRVDNYCTFGMIDNMCIMGWEDDTLHTL